jgi:hypothetical protein
MYSTKHTNLEVNQVNAYLAAKYGITLKGGESNESHDTNVTTGNAVGQIITARTNARITSVTFRTDSATPNSASGNLLICTGAITTLPNSTNVANCVASPAHTQAISIPTALSTNAVFTLSTPFEITAGTAYAIILTGTNIRVRGNSTDVYGGGNAFNTAGSLAPQDLYFDYITDAPDYVASNGTTEMWNNDAAGALAGYNNAITVVGRDDTSNLWQPKSKSQLTTGSPLIEIVDNTAVADMEFLAIAGNTGALGHQFTELPSTGLPPFTNARLAREWQVQKTGDVGTVNLSWDLAEHSLGATDMNQVRLLIDADGDFSTGASISSITPTISGTTITFSSVTLTNGQYLTVALPFNAK